VGRTVRARHTLCKHTPRSTHCTQQCMSELTEGHPLPRLIHSNSDCNTNSCDVCGKYTSLFQQHLATPTPPKPLHQHTYEVSWALLGEIRRTIKTRHTSTLGPPHHRRERDTHKQTCAHTPGPKPARCTSLRPPPSQRWPLKSRRSASWLIREGRQGDVCVCTHVGVWVSVSTQKQNRTDC
jgi:hypothetical protein